MKSGYIITDLFERGCLYLGFTRSSTCVPNWEYYFCKLLSFDSIISYKALLCRPPATYRLFGYFWNGKKKNWSVWYPRYHRLRTSVPLGLFRATALPLTGVLPHVQHWNNLQKHWPKTNSELTVIIEQYSFFFQKLFLAYSDSFHKYRHARLSHTLIFSLLLKFSCPRNLIFWQGVM